MRITRISRWALAIAAPAMALSLISAPAAAAEEAPEAQIVDITPMVMAALDEEGGATADAAPVAAAADLYEASPRNAFNVSTAAKSRLDGFTLQVRRGLVTRSSSNDVAIAWARVTSGADRGDSLSIIVTNSHGTRVANDGTRVSGTTYTNGFQIKRGFRYKACISDTAVGCDNSVSKVM
ncbi:hypothetical protein O4J56_27755 [Nocardiopsis sp. RSe5-2]|uniref:Uncharacterized protein n=1 Tax=Nocardiopsis endophytica TaxID=3018445 RepID=A0ABT4UBW8_9ACTN|nr:hypothetical protein [Nocardiopsis endophytica]MDA2814472.1 hypothetical protein [Nocardiopsis endophytica]